MSLGLPPARLLGEKPFLGLVAHLFADRHVITLIDQSRQVILDGMIWDPRHWNAHAFRHVAPGEDQVEFARGRFGVFVEGFIKVTQAEKDDGVWILPFDVEILLADGGYVFGHMFHFMLSGLFRQVLKEI